MASTIPYSGAPPTQYSPPEKFAQTPAAASRWRTSRWDWPIILSAFLILGAWLGAAIFLIARPRYGYFDVNAFDVMHRGLLGDGNYNVIVQVVGSLAGVVVGLAMATAFKAILLHRLSSERGLSLANFDAIAKLSVGGLIYKLSLAAVPAAVLCILTTQFGSATQAAFGSSVSKANDTLELALARIYQNEAFTNDYLSSAPLDMGDVANSIQRSWSATVPGYDPSTEFTIAGVTQVVNRTQPLLAVRLASAYAQQYINAGGASTSNDGYLYVEGAYVNATCRRSTIAWTQSSTTRSGRRYVDYTLPFACGTTSELFVADSPVPIWNTYGCPDGTVYVYNPLPTTATMGSIHSCTLSLATATFAAHYDQAAQVAKVAGSPEGYLPLTGSDLATLVAYVNLIFFNSNGPYGFPALTASMLVGANNDLNVTDLCAVAVEAAVKSALVKLMDALAFAANPTAVGNDPSLGFNSTVRTAVISTTILKIGLVGVQAAWLAIPGGLLIVLIVITFMYARERSGMLDFTDPLQVALVGLGSEYEPAFHGAATGEFVNEKKNELRLRFGVPLYQDPKYKLYGDGDHLVLADATGSGHALGKPMKGGMYS